jgi:hypothetical protein
LLDSNNIYAPSGTGAELVINSQSTLDFATALGDKIAIVNGSVTIDQNTTMDATQLAELMATIKSVTGDVSYTATATGVVPTAGFTALTGVATITLDVNGDVSLPALASASIVDIQDNIKVTSVSLPALKTVTTLSNLTFSRATSLDLSSLERYASDLVIDIKSGKVNLDAFVTTTTAANTPESGKTLHIDGADEVVAPLITGGKLLMDSVLEPNFPAWKGANNSKFDKATKVVLPSITGVVAIDVNAWAPKATYFHFIGLDGDDATSTSDDEDILFPSFTTGAAANGNLETLIIGGSATSVTITGNSDLTSVTFDGSTHALSIIDNDALTSLDLPYTSTVGGISAGSLTITGNEELESVTADSLDDISVLTIGGTTDATKNPALETLSFAALNSLGTDTAGDALDEAASITITGNNLSASLIQLPSPSTVLPSVAGKITTASGITALEDYITANVAGSAGSSLVTIDNVENVLDYLGADYTGTIKLTAATTAAGAQTWSADGDPINVVEISANTADTGDDARAEIKAFQIAAQATGGSTTLQITVDGIDLYDTAIAPSSNLTLALADIKEETALTRATAAGVTFNAVGGGAPTTKIEFLATASATLGEAYAGTAHSSTTVLAADDYVTLTINSQSVTATSGTSAASSTDGIATALVTAWNTKWATTGSASDTASLFSVNNDADSSTIVVSAKSGSGNRGNAKNVSISVNTGTDTSTIPVIDYVIGDTRATTDNKTVGEDIILTFENNSAGTIIPMPSIVVTTALASSTLTTTELFNEATAALNFKNTASNIYPTEARGIAQNAEDSVDAEDSDARTVNLVTWL